ncbi:putative meiotically up-regulated protein Msb1/Mug8 [Septoria linicola]|nr:putative meiotically up-regulated protein Msb1/Mug8 [Septoria linicola]
MPLFSRFKSKGAQPTSKAGGLENGEAAVQRPVRFQSRWESTTIEPEEIVELVHACTAEMKTRAEALDSPFMLLPFRPNTDPQGARTFIHNFYKSNAERGTQYRGDSLKQELRLTDSLVLCSIIKWCWSRMPSGVVSWPVYEGFRIGEKEAYMARNAFDTFIPIGVDSEARRSIIVDFYDLLASVSAHGKLNGLGGRKLSRMAGWWAFDHSDDGIGFEGGYKSWEKAADASSHLFFAYLRSLSPETDPSMNVIERIPRSLQALLASTEYPPETPTLLQRSTPRVVMMVDTVSPTPFALLRRAKNFEYRDRDHVLRSFAEFEDPIDALTDECKRVLLAVSNTNSSLTIARSRKGLATKPDESWSAFSNMGFSDIDEKALTQKPTTALNGSTKTIGQGLRNEPRSTTADAGRPTTPSWADFLSAGFTDDGSPKSPTLLYPPAQVLPPLGSRSSSQGYTEGIDENLAPGELAAIANVELDDAFWWVWMTSLAGEEPSGRKAVFGRCALVETTIANGAWLIMEEQVKGASPDPTAGVYMAPKKGLFSFTKRGRLSRKDRSLAKSPTTEHAPERALSATPSKTSISTDQHAKIKAAARALARSKQGDPESDAATRRGRHDEEQSSKTNSMLTLGISSEAGPAMKWASSYDKHAIRQQYLGDNLAGKGMSREELVRKTSNNSLVLPDNRSQPVVAPASPALHKAASRELPPLPQEEPAQVIAERVFSAPLANEPALSLVPSTTSTTAPAAAPEPEPVAPPQAPSPAPAQVPVESASAFDKEIGLGSSTNSNRVGRKPVPKTTDHPANREVNAKQTPHVPTSNPAAMAAARAMHKEPESPENRFKKTSGASGGLKKFFGKKKDTGTRGDSFEAMRPGSNGLVPPAENSISRRLSLMRRKHTTPASPRASESTIDRPAQEPAVTAAVAAATKGHNYPPTEASRSSIHERTLAEDEFSRFDQGPIDDMPAAMPTDVDDKPSPLPIESKMHSYANRQHSVHSQADSVADDHDRFMAPSSRGDIEDDRQSEATMEDHHDPVVVQDRWAQIRENAHKRAERTRQSEDLSTEQSRPSRVTDDGETSGEETIESRVARIKARVAELTGNMEGVQR